MKLELLGYFTVRLRGTVLCLTSDLIILVRAVRTELEPICFLVPFLPRARHSLLCICTGSVFSTSEMQYNLVSEVTL